MTVEIVHRYNWHSRARAAATLVGPEVRSVADIGCGRRTLELYLPPTVQRYVGVDERCDVGADVVCRLSGTLPDLGRFDLAIALGFWEYLTDREIGAVAEGLLRYSDRLLFSCYAGHPIYQRSPAVVLALLSSVGWLCQHAGGLGRRCEALYLGRT